MPRKNIYRVETREIWTQDHLVEADDAAHAKERIFEGSGDPIETSFEYSRCNDRDEWEVHIDYLRSWTATFDDKEEFPSGRPDTLHELALDLEIRDVTNRINEGTQYLLYNISCEFGSLEDFNSKMQEIYDEAKSLA